MFILSAIIAAAGLGATVGGAVATVAGTSAVVGGAIGTLAGAGLGLVAGAAEAASGQASS